MKNTPQIYILFVFFFVSVLTTSCDLEGSLKDPSEPATTDMTPVDIVLALINRKTSAPIYEWHFKIPKAYITNKKGWKGGQFDVLNIEARFPDLKPQKYSFRNTAKKDTPEFRKLNAKKEKGISISLYAWRVDKLNGYEKRVKSLEQMYDRQNEKLHGLVRYLNKNSCVNGNRPDNNESENCVDDGKEYLITESNNENSWVEFNCRRIDVKSNKGCRVNTDFEGIQVVYLFRRNELQRWREYDQAIKELLGRFYVKSVDHLNK